MSRLASRAAAAAAAPLLPLPRQGGHAARTLLAVRHFSALKGGLKSRKRQRAEQPQQAVIRAGLGVGFNKGTQQRRRASGMAVREAVQGEHDEGSGHSSDGDDDDDDDDDDDEDEDDVDDDDDDDDEDESEDEEDYDIALLEKRRARKEWKDSINDDIVEERRRHLHRLWDFEIDPEGLRKMRKLGLGKRRKGGDTKAFNKRFGDDGKKEKNSMGAGGFSALLGATDGHWPRFKHPLPEIAMAGHTNCGKSTLVNALSGIHPTTGVAKVSPRAGWTEYVSFYQLGKKPPVLILADLPGHGFAVASQRLQKAWKYMVKNYIKERRSLCRVCLLVDSTRGLCEEDRLLIDHLEKVGREYQVVLTKADLLTPQQLARCMNLIRADLEGSKTLVPQVEVVSGAQGAGVNYLWKQLVNRTVQEPNSLLGRMRKHEWQRQEKKDGAVRAEE